MGNLWKNNKRGVFWSLKTRNRQKETKQQIKKNGKQKKQDKDAAADYPL